MPTPRLLVVTELFLPTKGGTAVWFAEVYGRLGGRDVHIVTADVPDAAAFDAGHPNSIHRLRLQRKSWLRPESLGIYAKLLAKSLALAMAQRPSGVHAGRALPEGLIAWLVGRLTWRPAVVYAHGEELTTWGRGAKYKTMRFVFRHADKVIANSEFTREQLIRMGVKAKSIALIYPGVDTEKFSPGLPCDDLKQQIGLLAGEKLLLSIGRLQRRKGFDMVIKVLPELLSEGISTRYVIIGIGEDHDYLATLAKQLGVESHVHLLGSVTEETLPRWLNAADVFVMPNREVGGDTEGFGIVFMEAAACGKASVAGRAGGTGSAVQDGVTGFRVDGENLSALEERLKELLTDEELCASLGGNGLARARNEFDWRRVTERTRASLRQG